MRGLRHSPYTCVAAGTWLQGRRYPLLAEASYGGAWTTSRVGTPAHLNSVTWGTDVSCAPVRNALPYCLIVGVHYQSFSNPSYVQVAEWGRPGAFHIVEAQNPAGTTTSDMIAASCPSTHFCLITGVAGSANSQHVTAYVWNGRRMRALTIPQPLNGRGPDLEGVSCATTTNCVAVGTYKNSSGTLVSYSAIWSKGQWTLKATPYIAGGGGTVLASVSCPRPATCMAVGFTERAHPFSESWNGHAWRLIRTSPAARMNAGLQSVSCPALKRCYASGWYGNSGLVEFWNGATWKVLHAVRTPRGLADDIEGISCVSSLSCAATGVRYSQNTKDYYSFRALAESWNGKTWVVEPAVSH